MRIKLTIDYIGTAYAGWQVQPEQKTVQGELEAALKTLTGQTVGVTASGRTDAGVHACGQVAHFDTDRTWDAKVYVGGLNRYLPRDIRVLAAEAVPETFHARFSAKRKTYVYRMYRSSVARAVYAGRAVRIEPSVDVAAMQAAAERLVGTHDFAAFVAAGADTATTTRTVFDAKVSQTRDEVYFTVTADGFLYNMVRIMVGLLLRVGYGAMAPDDVSDVLASCDRTRARDTAPACGLYLYNVEYPSNTTTENN